MSTAFTIALIASRPISASSEHRRVSRTCGSISICSSQRGAVANRGKPIEALLFDQSQSARRRRGGAASEVEVELVRASVATHATRRPFARSIPTPWRLCWSSGPERSIRKIDNFLPNGTGADIVFQKSGIGNLALSRAAPDRNLVLRAGNDSDMALQANEIAQNGPGQVQLRQSA
jgi:hypothetical protein